MATLIGVVSQVIGEVYAVAGDGTRRPLSEGDRVFAGEQIVTGASGSIAVAMSNGQQLTLGRDSSLNLTEQMLAGSSEPQNPTAEAPPAAPSDGELTDVEKLQAAIEAGVDPTLEGEATAAGPGGGGAGGAGGAGGGHSFVLLGETGGQLDPTIGFPTAGFSTGPEFPNPEPEVSDPDFNPTITIEYRDAEGSLVTGPGIVDEEALIDGTNPGSNAEQANGAIIIDSPDGISSLQIQGFNGVWVDVTAGGVVQGQYGTLSVDAAGNWTYTLTDNTLDHTDPNATGADDQLGESFPVRMFDLDGDVSPTVQLNVLVNDDGPILSEGEQSSIRAIVDEDETIDGNSDGDGVTNVAAGGPGALSALVNFGADGMGSFGLSGAPSAIATLEAQGLSSGTTALSYAVVGDTLTASAGAETIFTLQVGVDGSFTFTLVGQLDHPVTDGNDDEMLDFPIDFSGVLTATDGDGDSVGTFNEGSFVIDVEDDVPVLAGVEYEEGDGEYEYSQSYVSRPSVGGIVHEDALTIGGDFNAPYEGNNEDSDGVGQDDDSAQTVTLNGGPGALSVLVNFGADGPGDFGISADLSGLDAQMLTSGGVLITYGFEGDMLVAKAGALEIFTLSVNGDGSYEFVLKGPLDHPVQDGDFDSEDLPGLGIDFSTVMTATDGDGDPLVGGFPRGSFYIDVEDDVPVLNGGAAVGTTLTVTLEGSNAGFANTYGYYVKDGLGNPVSGTIIWVNVQDVGAPIQLEGVNPDSIGFFIIPNGASNNVLSGYENGASLTFAEVSGEWQAFLNGQPLVGSGGANVLFDNPLLNPSASAQFTDNGAPGNQNWEDISGGGDGDFNDVNIQVDWQHATVNEDALSTPHDGNDDPDQTLVASGSGAGGLSSLVAFGADGPGEFGLSNDPVDIATMESQGLTSGGVALTYGVVGNVLTASAGADTIFTLTVNADGSWEFVLSGPLDHPLPGSTDDNQLLGLPIDFSGVLTATDGDGDPVGDFAAGSFAVNVEDDVPLAQNDNATVLAGEGLDFNAVFVLDFSGSIDNTELNTMLEAVRAAGQALFSGTTGDVNIQIVAFSGDSASYPVLNNFASFSALIDSLNPADGGTRPFSGLTDFTDGIQETMAAYTPIPGWSNQVFFISDGAPNEQTGTGGNSLSDATAAAWNTFVDSNGINVTTIGVGNGINTPRLQDVDLDGTGAPILVANFDDLIDTLVNQVIGGLVGGNVLLGSDNAVGGGDDDAFGADGPGQILSIDINGVTYTWDGAGNIDASSGPDIAGNQLTDITTAEGGKLSFNFTTGAWNYQAPATVSGDKTETFSYTIIDNDGDPSTANLTVYVEDTSPVIAAVDEDELPGGITDGDAVTTVATGSLSDLVVGPPVAAQFTLSTDTSGLAPATSNGVALVYGVVGNVLTATAGPAGPTVFTLQVQSNGDYTFTLSGSLDHPSAGTDDSELLVMNFASILEASDGTDPLALAGDFLVQIENDVPVIAATAAPNDVLQVDETNLALNSTANFGSLFTSNYGGDGPGTTAFSLQISASGANTGLDDVATGNSIYLFMQGNDVVGRVSNSGGAIVFRVSVNSNTGAVTLDQLRAIEHSPNTSADQETNLAAANQIQLVGTIVDDDGDSSSATVNLGSAISFKDDGPSISASAVAAGSLRVDESNLGSNDTDDFSSLFTSSYGADGAGDIDYDLSVSAVGADSGLDDTATGQSILLYMQGNDVVGRVGGPAGAIAFRVSVDGSGDVTLDQQRAIIHTPNTGPDQTASLVAANLIKLTATITDEDGDSASSTIDIGHSLAFEDDAPEIDGRSVSNDSLQVDETNLAVNDSTDFSGNFDDAYGADGAGTTVYSLNVSAVGANSGLDDTATGQDILLFNEAGVIVGRVGSAVGAVSFTVSVNAGTGVVTLDQQRAIFHTPNSGDNQESSLASANLVQLSATITDKDGDTDSATINLGHTISFKDDGPSISASSAGNDSLQVDETVLATNATANFSSLFTSSYGADGAGTTTYSLNVSSSGVNSGLDDSATGSDIRLYLEGANVVGRVGSAAGAVSFVVSVSASGQVTLDQQRAIIHTPNSGADQESSLGSSNMVQLTATITDKDGDSDSETVNLGSAISFKDDGPSISAVAAGNDSLQVDETVLATNATSNFSSLFTSSYGADGAGTTTYSLSVSAAGVDSGLDDTATGSNILLFLEAGNVVGRVGSAAGAVSFSVTVNASGQVTLDQQRAIIHTPNSGPDQETSLASANLVQLTATITDKDGDSNTATVSLGSAISFKDDGPSISASAAGNDSLQVDETVLATNATTNFAGLFSGNYGADGAGTTTYSLNVSAAGVDSGLDDSATGSNILLYLESGNVVGRVGSAAGAVSFTVTVNASGQVTLDQQRAIIHTPNSGADQESSLAAANLVQLNATITDADGDSNTATVNLGSAISFKDDGPTISSNAAVQLDDDALANGIPGGPGGTDDANSVNTSGTLGHTFGADGAGSVQWLTSGAPGGFTYAAGPAGSLLVIQGATTVLTVTLNSASGAYTVTQNAPIQHANADQENNQAFTLTYQVTDKDGDTANGTLGINVDDDTPLARNDVANVAANQGQDFNVAFVLDFSGSIDDAELNIMLEAVRAAGQELFNSSAGDVSIKVVAFSGDSASYPLVTNFAAFSALIDSLNPDDGGTRPFSGLTDFTDGIQETMAAYVPIPGSSNQVFFISDGAPNEQTGTGGNSLSDATAAAWNTFVDSNGINVTTIGVGNGINIPRLQDVDLDGSGAPLLVADFDDLIDTLLGQIGALVSGNVLLGSDNAVGGGDDDGYGADGPGYIQSIVINGITYVWDGAGTIDPSSGPNIAGSQLTDITTPEGGTLDFNFSTGAWTYQAPSNVVGDKTETFTYSIVDKDGDPSTAILTVYVEDSGPVEGFVDEDNLPTGIIDPDLVTDVASGSVASLVVGPDAGSQFTLSNAPADLAGITAASSGGVALVYSVLGDTLTAKAGAAGPVVFTLQVATDGTYTFNLDKALDHPLDGSNDAQLLALDFTSILLASNGINPLALAGNFLIHVEDDIPLIDAGLSGQLPAALNTQDAQTIGASTDTASSNFSAAFSATANHGADGPGMVSWSYSLGLLVAEGALSGMSSNNLTVKLYENGGVITGSTAGSEAGVNAGNTVFSLSVSGAGLVTLNQFAEIDHTPGGATINYDVQEAVLASNLVGLTGTASITDYDGDTHVDSAVLDLGGKVAFDDDGPSISLGLGTSPVPVLNTQDAQTIAAASDVDSASFSAAFNVTASNYGADGAGTVATAYTLTMLAAEGTSSGLSTDGATIYLYENGGVITGSTSANEAGVNGSNSVFTLSVNGAGQVTLTQLKEIDHNPGGATTNYSAQEAVLASNLVGLKATVTITDGDGDTATANQTLDLGGKVAFDDDGPSISATAPGSNTLQVDETNLLGDATANYGGLFSPSYGADGAGTTVYSLSVSAAGVDSGLDDSATGSSILLFNEAGVIVGRVGSAVGAVSFTVSVNASGQVTLDQQKAILHTPNSTADQASSLVAANLVQLNATVTDGDGDVAVTTVNLGSAISFKDDGPTTSSNATVQLDDDALANGIPGGPGGTDDANSVNTSGTLGLNFGADGAGTVQWQTSGEPSGFTYATGPGGSLLISQGATLVLTVTMNSATGAYTVTQSAAIQHATANQENNQAFTLTYQVTDKDGDPATGTLAINVDDDTPVAQNDSASVAEGSGEDFNVAFVLDSSGSISNSEFSTMMNAVKAAGQALFNGTSGDVKVTIVAFSSDSLAYTPVTTLATFNAQVDSIIASRPFSGSTDFTDGIQEAMLAYTPIPGWSNQVFFISDGNPNEQTGSGGNSLSDATAAAWNTFVDSNGINVTTIGVGDGINNARLQDVDLDGSGAPILVSEFDDLIDTLLDQIAGGDVSGNVLLGNNNAVGGGDDDGFGADGAGRIQSISINGITYVWDGGAVIDPSSGPNIAGNSLSNITTAQGGKLSFSFATGAWSYVAPVSVNADTNEVFNYTILDKDGDPSSANLTVTILDVNQAPSGANATLSIAEDSSKVFSAADFGFSDSDGDSLLSVKITTLPAVGSLTYNGGAVPAEILAGNLGLLVYTPAANASGNGYASFTFQVRDNGGTVSGGVDLDATPNQITFNVTPVNDAPSATISNLSYNATEDSNLVLKGTGLSVADSDAGSGSVSVTLSVGQGRLTGTAGNSGVTVGGNNTAALTLSGTLAQVNAFLGAASTSTLVYNANINAPAATTMLALLINDNGNTGGGSLSAIDTAVINITPASDATNANDDDVRTNIGNVSVAIPEWALTWNDTDADGRLDVSAIGSIVGGTASQTTGTSFYGSVNFNDNNGNTGGGNSNSSFSYTSSDGSSSDSATVAILLDTSGTLDGNNSNNILVDGIAAANTTLNGSDGNDVLIGNDGNDTLNGGDDNDLLVGGSGNDALNGNADNDTAGYFDAGAGVTVSLATALQQNTVGAGLDTLNSIENLIGSRFDDALTGSSGNNSLIGLEGDDILIGNGGTDSLTGSAGEDTFKWLSGNTGVTTITDFVKGVDSLDLSQLLTGEDDTASSLSQYLTFTFSTDTTITVDSNGAAGGGSGQSIVLQGINLQAAYGAADAAGVITSMLGDDSLKVDTV